MTITVDREYVVRVLGEPLNGIQLGLVYDAYDTPLKIIEVLLARRPTGHIYVAALQFKVYIRSVTLPHPPGALPKGGRDMLCVELSGVCKCGRIFRPGIYVRSKG